MLEELARFEPEIAAAASQAVALAGKDLGFIVLDREFFAKAPKTSIDYAVMERTHGPRCWPLTSAGRTSASGRRSGG